METYPELEVPIAVVDCASKGVGAETGRDMLSGARTRITEHDGLYSMRTSIRPIVLDAGSRKFWISAENAWSRER